MSTLDEELRAALRARLQRFIDPDDDTMPAPNWVDGGFTWVSVEPVLDDLMQVVGPLQHMYLEAMSNLGRAADKLDVVRELHQPSGVVAAAEAGEPADCATCGPNTWPCPTIRALDRVEAP